MSSPARDQDVFPLPVLFFSVGGVHFGVSADQVRSTAVHGLEGDGREIWLDREMDCPGGTRPLSFTALDVRLAGGESLTVIVDAMEEITEVEALDIRPLPPLVAPHARRKGLWGVIPRAGRMYLLMDFSLWKEPLKGTHS